MNADANVDVWNAVERCEMGMWMGIWDIRGIYDSPTCDADVDANGVPMMPNMRMIPERVRTHIPRKSNKDEG